VVNSSYNSSKVVFVQIRDVIRARDVNEATTIGQPIPLEASAGFSQRQNEIRIKMSPPLKKDLRLTLCYVIEQEKSKLSVHERRQVHTHVLFKINSYLVKHHRVDDLHRPLYIKQVPASHGYLNRFRLFSMGIIVSQHCLRCPDTDTRAPTRLQTKKKNSTRADQQHLRRPHVA
jgi:hypothetical protein